MGQGKPLSSFELGQMVAYREAGLSYGRIAEIIGCSKATVWNNVNSKRKPTQEQKKRGPKQKVSVQEQRQIVKLALTGKYSLREIQRELPTHRSLYTINKYVRKHPNVGFGKRQSRPLLKERHINARLEYASAKMDMGNQWKKVIFSDEKKFNLDGPDGFAYHWYDLRKEPQILSKRAFGGGSLVIWGAFGYNDRSELVTIPTKTNSELYQEVLKANLLRQGSKMGGRGWIFQQDNASVHKSASTLEFLAKNKVRILDWPACSPDLNPIENAWGYLARKLYAHGKQYSNVKELETAIHQEWSQIPQDYFQKLIDSMPNRIFKLISKGGQFIGY